MKSARSTGIFEIIVFSRKDEICVSIGAKPQLHRFSLGRFAARTREISPRETYRPSRPSRPRRPIFDLQLVTHDYTARYIGGMHPGAPDPPPWFFLVFSLTVAVSVTCTRAHVYTSSRFFIPLGHVYPREGNVRRKENVSPRRRQILSRSRRWRNGSYTMAEKRGTKYLICGRTELAPSDEMYFSSRIRTRLLSRWTLPSIQDGRLGRRIRSAKILIFFVIATIASNCYYANTCVMLKFIIVLYYKFIIVL